VNERRRGRRVDAARQPADDAGIADLGADAFELLGDHRSRRPFLDAPGDLAQEPLEDLLPVRRVDDLGVKLDAVETTLGVLERSNRRTGAGGKRIEAVGRREDGVAVAHPALLFGRQPRQQLAAVTGQRQRCAPELTRLGAFDAAAELEHHGLHPVTDAEHGDAEFEQLAAQARSTLGVHGCRPPREHEGGRVAVADDLEVEVVGQHLGVDLALANTAGDQLRVLATEVEHENLLMRGLGRSDIDRLVDPGLNRKRRIAVGQRPTRTGR
jgi:hypothetical protein